jgi:hypothetical protein
MSSQKKGRVQMIERQRVQQAAADEAKKLVDASVDAAKILATATKETEEFITMDDSLRQSLRKLLPDLVILIQIQGIQWLETATCEREFSLRTQILTARSHSMGDSLLACLMMICSIVVSEGGGGEISFCCRCEIQGFQEEGAVHLLMMMPFICSCRNNK